jgi:large subunit ribosomal protein L25
MQTFSLQASTRSATGKRAHTVTRHRRIPAVLYGHGVKNQNLELDPIAFQKIFRDAGSSSLVDLQIGEGSAVKVLIHAIQRHPTRTNVTHVDFYQVKMTETLQTEIELELTGEAPAVKEQGGILIRALDKVKVECLPVDLVSSIAVDISNLKTFDDHIRVADLKLPKGITVLDNPEEMVVTVQAPRSEEEIAALSGEVTEDVTAVGTVEKPKAEAEEGEAVVAEKTEQKTDK